MKSRIFTARDAFPGCLREVRIYVGPGEFAGEVEKDLLKKRGIAFREIKVEEDYLLRAWIASAAGSVALPQIFVDGESIGGAQELIELDASGELIPRIMR